MSIQERLKRARVTLARKREHKVESRAQVKQLRTALSRVEKAIDGHRAAAKGATEEEKERHADRLDNLRGRRRHLESELEVERSRLPRLKKRVKALAKRCRHLANKVALSKDYASPHFRWDEFNCNDGTPFPSASRDAIKAWCADIGEPVRSRCGSVHINSAYRHAAYNASVGGASNSIHIYDQHPNAVAVDHRCDGASPSTVASVEEPWADGLGRYASFTHADNRCRIGWPKSRWSG